MRQRRQIVGIGAKAVASATPDGYTLLLGFDGSLVVAPHLIKAPFDTLKDFTPIGMMATAPVVLTAAPHTGIKSIPELLDLLRRLYCFGLSLMKLDLPAGVDVEIKLQ